MRKALRAVRHVASPSAVTEKGQPLLSRSVMSSDTNQINESTSPGENAANQRYTGRVKKAQSYPAAELATRLKAEGLCFLPCSDAPVSRNACSELGVHPCTTTSSEARERREIR